LPLDAKGGRLLIWQEICIATNQKAVDAVANLLHELGFGGVVIEEPFRIPANSEDYSQEDLGIAAATIPKDQIVLKAYLPSEGEGSSAVSNESPILLELRRQLSQLAVRLELGVGAVALTLAAVDEEDWANAWKQFYQPVKVSRTIVIKPTWEAYSPRPGEIIVELDPGMAFGTGTHPTTLHCLHALERYLQKGQIAVDVGTGSGILAIAAVKLGAEKVYAIDVDPIAVAIARENITRNQVEQQVELMLGDGLESLASREGLVVDLVVGNLVTAILQKIGRSVFQKLKPQGLFICAGIIQGRLTEVLENLKTIGFCLVEITDESDWSTLVLVKPE